LTHPTCEPSTGPLEPEARPRKEVRPGDLLVERTEQVARAEHEHDVTPLAFSAEPRARTEVRERPLEHVALTRSAERHSPVGEEPVGPIAARDTFLEVCDELRRRLNGRPDRARNIAAVHAPRPSLTSSQ